MLITSYFLLIYTDFVYDPQIRYEMGEINFWFNIVVIIINILICIFLVVLPIFKLINAKCKRYWDLRRKKK